MRLGSTASPHVFAANTPVVEMYSKLGVMKDSERDAVIRYVRDLASADLVERLRASTRGDVNATS